MSMNSTYNVSKYVSGRRSSGNNQSIFISIENSNAMQNTNTHMSGKYDHVQSRVNQSIEDYQINNRRSLSMTHNDMVNQKIKNIVRDRNASVGGLTGSSNLLAMDTSIDRPENIDSTVK